MEHLYQISHEELLLLSGLLRLAPPLVLGPRPAAGYSRPALHSALGAAASSLVARGLLAMPPSPRALPTPDPRLAEALRALAVAARCLVVASSQGSRHTAGQIEMRPAGDALVLSAAQPGIYGLYSAHSRGAVIDHLIATIRATEDLADTQLQIPPTALLAAVAAAPAGPQTPIAILQDSGLVDGDAASFARCLGPAPAQHALLALRDGVRPERRGSLTIVGLSATWIADDDAHTDRVTLRPVDAAGLRAHIAGTVAWAAAA